LKTVLTAAFGSLTLGGTGTDILTEVLMKFFTIQEVFNSRGPLAGVSLAKSAMSKGDPEFQLDFLEHGRAIALNRQFPTKR